MELWIIVCVVSREFFEEYYIEQMYLDLIQNQLVRSERHLRLRPVHPVVDTSFKEVIY